MKVLLYGTLVAGLLLAAGRPLLAGSPAAAEEAAAAVLFELDVENASYKVRHDGHLDILFGASLPAERYRQALDALHAHPDIPGVLAGRGSADFCPPLTGHAAARTPRAGLLPLVAAATVSRHEQRTPTSRT